MPVHRIRRIRRSFGRSLTGSSTLPRARAGRLWSRHTGANIAQAAFREPEPAVEHVACLRRQTIGVVDQQQQPAAFGAHFRRHDELRPSVVLALLSDCFEHPAREIVRGQIRIGDVDRGGLPGGSFGQHAQQQRFSGARRAGEPNRSRIPVPRGVAR